MVSCTSFYPKQKPRSQEESSSEPRDLEITDYPRSGAEPDIGPPPLVSNNSVPECCRCIPVGQLLCSLRGTNQLTADLPTFIGCSVDVDIPLAGFELRNLRIGQCRRPLDWAGEIAGERHDHPGIRTGIGWAVDM